MILLYTPRQTGGFFCFPFCFGNVNRYFLFPSLPLLFLVTPSACWIFFDINWLIVINFCEIFSAVVSIFRGQEIMQKVKRFAQNTSVSDLGDFYLFLAKPTWYFCSGWSDGLVPVRMAARKKGLSWRCGCHGWKTGSVRSRSKWNEQRWTGFSMPWAWIP